MEHVLRWKGFERVLPPDGPYHEKRIEMTLGEHVVDRVVGESGAPQWIPLWAFDFKEVDSEGRRVYEATKDPYEDEFELYEQQKLAQWRFTHRKIRHVGEGAQGDGQ
jgi:hypothetical protein